MAQDFERNTANGVGTSASTLRTANSDDAIVGITVANVHTAQITVIQPSSFASIELLDEHEDLMHCGLGSSDALLVLCFQSPPIRLG